MKVCRDAESCGAKTWNVEGNDSIPSVGLDRYMINGANEGACANVPASWWERGGATCINDTCWEPHSRSHVLIDINDHQRRTPATKTKPMHLVIR